VRGWAINGAPRSPTGVRNLPLLPGQLVGRDAELSLLSRAIGDPDRRLTTLTGPAGTGKTRLACAAAAAIADCFADGSVFVDLAPLPEPGLVAGALAQALGLDVEGSRPTIRALGDYLAGRDMLVVLDNFEHVLEAAPLVADLLAMCPAPRFLVTSRAPLRLRWEHEHPLGPLALPDPARLPSAEELRSVPAVALFRERARAVRPDFEVTEANAASVAQVCALLDGLPLAIELAAARVRLYAPEALLSLRAQGIGFLDRAARDSPDRHRSLRAALDWSHGLLAPTEQTVFRRLAAFAGGFTLGGAEAVCGWGDCRAGAVGPAVETLAEHSLVAPIAAGDEPRFRLLEVVREYAAERLELAGEVEAAQRAHADYFLALAEAGAAEMPGPHEAAWLDRLELEHSNLRATLRACQANGRGATGLRLAAALWFFWYVRGHIPEGRSWLDRFLASDEAENGALAEALIGCGHLAWLMADLPAARARLDRALEIARALADPRQESLALTELAVVALMQGDTSGAVRLAEEGAALAATIGTVGALTWPLYWRGMTLQAAGELETARRCFQESAATSRAHGTSIGLAAAMSKLALLAYRQGDLDAAGEYLAQALPLQLSIGQKRAIGQSLLVAAAVAANRGEDARAVQLAAATEAMRSAIGSPLTDGDLVYFRPAMDAARARLGEPAHETARAEGLRLSLADAATLALAPPRAAARTGPGPLSARELEVAELVARGLTNREIADALVISPHTAIRHVEHILNKLGLRSRTQVAAWVAKQAQPG